MKNAIKFSFIFCTLLRMANQASKKRSKENAPYIKYMNMYFIGINVWFFIYNLLFLRAKNLTWGTMILYFIHAAIQGVCFFWVRNNLETMMFSEAIEGYGGDVLIISAIISLFLPFTRKWMWVYIVIPGYIVYILIKKLVDYALTPDPTPEEVEDSKSKRQKKRDLKMAKAKNQ